MCVTHTDKAVKNVYRQHVHLKASKPDLLSQTQLASSLPFPMADVNSFLNKNCGSGLPSQKTDACMENAHASQCWSSEVPGCLFLRLCHVTIAAGGLQTENRATS